MKNPSSIPFPEFPSTHWTQVALASGSLSDAASFDALSRLLEKYWHALVAFLVRQHHLSVQEAEDTVQAFVQRGIHQTNFLAQARKDKGRFRTFLLTSLRNFARDEARKRRAKSRRPPGGFVDVNDPELQAEIPAVDEMDYGSTAWARELLLNAVGLMKQACENAGRSDIWQVFEGQIWRPLIDGTPNANANELAAALGVTPARVHELKRMAQRHFSKAVHSLVAEYATGEAEIQSEISYLLEVLCRSRRKLS
ncbi:MAG: hypothetical protein AB1813_01535 [Verrucomicrobiota bacterium]